MKKVIITGASGFIGKALCKRLLDDGYYVYAVVRNKEKMKDIVENNNLKIIVLDLKNYIDLFKYIDDKIDYFFHLSWDGVSGDALTSYERQLKNVKNSCDTIISVSKMKVGKFIFAGTVNELEIVSYINKYNIFPRMACIYGSSKLLAEMMLKTLAFNNNILINIALIGSIFGPNDESRMVQNIVISELLKGNSPKLVGGDMMYDWVYIDDVVEGLIKIAELGIPQKSYYVGHRKFRTFREIIEETRDIINPTIKLEFGTIKDYTNIDYTLIDIEELYKDTGYEAKADFINSIKETAEWVKKLYQIY
jgi:NAD-dependent epimerase/dehydratase